MSSKKKAAVVAEKTEEKVEAKSPVSRHYLWIGLCALALIGLLAGGYYYFQYQKAKSDNSIEVAQMEQKNLVERVGRLIALPQGEEPAIATVSDVAKLKNQPFFVNAKNGDRVLIYSKAKKAILYDPIANKILEVGPVDLGQSAPTPSVASLPDSVRVTINNGTTIVGLAAKIEQQLLSTSSVKIDVVSKGNAKYRTYTKPLVIDLSGTNSQTATQIAEIIGGEVGQLPKDESKPDNVDILVIAGQETP